MNAFGNITGYFNPFRAAVSLLLIAGVYVLYYAFSRYGLAGGGAVAIIPAAMCMLWVTIRNPAWSMLGMFTVNYFIMSLTRYLYDVPFGVILDAMIFYNILMITMQALVRRVEWRRALSGLTAAATIWMLYCVLELFNPEAHAPMAGWSTAVRSVAFYFLLVVILTQIAINEFRYVKYMIAIWTVLTLIAVTKACIQKFVGFNEAEKIWLYAYGARSTHIIHSGIRYFSFFSDAANFGASMGQSMVVFAIASLYYRNWWMKAYLLTVAGVACYGLLISGTRSALAVPFAGFAAFICMSRNFRIIVSGAILVFGAFVFLNFTTIGHGNAIIRRARSAFDTEDASFQVRLENQAKLRELMADKPFGAGIGHGGGKALRYAPSSQVAQIPTDSWFVMIWVETGVVGILLHLSVLFYILGHGAYLVIFKLKTPQVRGITAALISGIAGIVVMSYANEVLGQMPTGTILYMSMGIIFLSPRFDREMQEKLTTKS